MHVYWEKSVKNLSMYTCLFGRREYLLTYYTTQNLPNSMDYWLLENDYTKTKDSKTLPMSQITMSKEHVL